MNRATKLSLVLNALLLSFVIWWTSAAPRPEMRAAPSQCLATNRGQRAKQTPVRPPPPREPLPEVVEIIELFHWTQIESADYRIYLANLRAIGCPEPTVRDIIIADVNEMFAPRVKALVDEVTGQFWELIVRPDDFEKMIGAKHSQLRGVDDERDELLAELFGGSDPRSTERGERDAAERRAQWEWIADFLSEAKRAQFVAAKAELESRWTDFLRRPGLTGDQQQAKRKELEAASDQAFRAGLTADEYHELRLRQSPVANLRDRLVGLDLNEETVRAVAKIEFAKAEAQAAFARPEADSKMRPAQLQQQAEAQIREMLGAESYTAWQRATDDRYEPIYRVTQRIELSAATAAQAYDLRRQAEEAANQARADTSLAGEERQALLRAIGAEARQSLSATLGPKGMAAYEKIDGSWMLQFRDPKP